MSGDDLEYFEHPSFGVYRVTIQCDDSKEVIYIAADDTKDALNIAEDVASDLSGYIECIKYVSGTFFMQGKQPE